MAIQLNQGVDAIANQWADVALTSNITGLASNTFNKAQFNSVLDNQDGAWDTTNFRFQPRLSGIYLVTAQLHFNSTSNDIIDAAVAVYKNGSNAFQGQQIFMNATGDAISDYTSNISVLTKMNGSTNFLEIFGYCLSNSGTAFSFIGNALDSWAKFLYVGTFRRA